MTRKARAAAVVLLRGVNVGGHRTFRPTELVKQLKHLDAVNIGAAGTFVIRKPVSRAGLRAQLAATLPFETGVAICDATEVVRLMASDPFAGEPAGPDLVRFVSVLIGKPRAEPSIPRQFPDSGSWLLKIVARDGPFVLGLYRRQMRAIGYLNALDRLFGVPVTTRNWNTMGAIVKALGLTNKRLE